MLCRRAGVVGKGKDAMVFRELFAKVLLDYVYSCCSILSKIILQFIEVVYILEYIIPEENTI